MGCIRKNNFLGFSGLKCNPELPQKNSLVENATNYLQHFKILHPLYITESRVLSWSWQNWIFQNLRKSPNILLKAVWFAENGNKFDDIILVGKCIWLADITLSETYTFTFEASTTAWKVSTYWVFSGPYFSAFRPEKTPYLSTFHVVYALRKRKFFYYHMI